MPDPGSGRFDPKRFANCANTTAASQAVLARYLNVTTGLVSQWSAGREPSARCAPKLLALVARKGLKAVR
jgi:putative transcriptional regulator